jgi:hypothetical protein
MPGYRKSEGFSIIKYSILLSPYRRFGHRCGNCEIRMKSGFWQCILKNGKKRFGIKLCKLCNSKRYTYDMVVYLDCVENTEMNKYEVINANYSKIVTLVSRGRFRRVDPNFLG